MPSFDIDPHEGVGGATPIPIKDKNASVKMALGMLERQGDKHHTEGVQ